MFEQQPVNIQGLRHAHACRRMAYGLSNLNFSFYILGVTAKGFYKNWLYAQ